MRYLRRNIKRIKRIKAVSAKESLNYEVGYLSQDLDDIMNILDDLPEEVAQSIYDPENKRGEIMSYLKPVRNSMTQMIDFLSDLLPKQ